MLILHALCRYTSEQLKCLPLKTVIVHPPSPPMESVIPPSFLNSKASSSAGPYPSHSLTRDTSAGPLNSAVSLLRSRLVIFLALLNDPLCRKSPALFFCSFTIQRSTCASSLALFSLTALLLVLGEEMKFVLLSLQRYD